MRSAIAKFLVVVTIGSLSSVIGLPSAHAVLSGCPKDWKLSDSTFPPMRTSELVMAQQQRRTTIQVNLASVGYSFTGTQFVTVQSAQRITNLQDITPVQLAVDRSLALLLSGQKIRASYDVIVGGCPEPGHFTLEGKFQSAKVSRTTFANYLTAIKAITDPSTGGAQFETSYFKTPLLVQTGSADLAKCQNQIISATASVEKKGSKQSAHFGGSCSLANGTWRDVLLLQESPNCLTAQPDTGPAKSYYSLPVGKKCKVALARTFTNAAPGSQTFGPSDIYILSEFTIPGKAIPVPTISQPSTKKPAAAAPKPATSSKKVVVVCTNGSKNVSVSGSCPSGFHRK